MFKRYQLVVFDWEGTIAENSLGHGIHAVREVAAQLHLGPMDEQLARSSISLGLRVAVKKLFPEAQLSQQEELMKEVQQALLVSASLVQLVPGAKETIRWLAEEGMNLAIATNKSAQGLERALQMSGLKNYIKVTRSASEAPAKPCPQMLQEIMDTFALDAKQTLMVGDSSSDMQMAVALGVDGVGMDFFQTEQEELRAAGALTVFHDYQHLAKYLKDN